MPTYVLPRKLVRLVDHLLRSTIHSRHPGTHGSRRLSPPWSLQIHPVGEIFTDPIIATAILDRLLHHLQHPRGQLPAEGQAQDRIHPQSLRSTRANHCSVRGGCLNFQPKKFFGSLFGRD